MRLIVYIEFRLVLKNLDFIVYLLGVCCLWYILNQDPVLLPQARYWILNIDPESTQQRKLKPRFAEPHMASLHPPRN